MLTELGTHDEELGPSQVHNLIEMVKKEQNVYDAIFYELIRQARVENSMSPPFVEVKCQIEILVKNQKCG